MANFCDFEIHVSGTKMAADLVLHSMPYTVEPDILYEGGTDEDYHLSFRGQCKWSVNYDVDDKWKGNVDVSKYDARIVKDANLKYEKYSLRAKSEGFHCTIAVHYWSEESGFDQFDYFENGKVIKRRKIAYSYAEPNVFDWSTSEFVGHDNVYDENVRGEENDLAVMNVIRRSNGLPPISLPSYNQQTNGSDQLSQFFKEVEDLFSEAGLSDMSSNTMHNSSIGDTGYDLYNWSFKERKKAFGNEWSVVIPDGFKRIKSDEGRLFELVPVDTTDFPLVQILPGKTVDGSILNNQWPYHPIARKYLSASTALTMLNATNQALALFGFDDGINDLMMFSTDEICGHCMYEIHSGENNNYPYDFQITVFGADKAQQLRVVASDYITPQQAEQLKQSILTWLNSFHFDKPNRRIPKTAPFDDPRIIDNLKNKNTNLFDQALNAAQGETNFALLGTLAELNHRYQNDIIDHSQIKPQIQEAFKVLEFYISKAEDLINRAKMQNVSPFVLENIYERIINELGNKNTYLKDLPLREETNDSFPVSVERTVEKLKKGMAENERKKEQSNQDEINRILKEREKRLEKALVDKKKELQRELDTIKNEQERIKRYIKEQENDRDDAQRELSSLGFFSFGRRDTLNSRIQYCNERIKSYQNDLKQSIERYKTAVDKQPQEIESFKQSYQRSLEFQLPFPGKEVKLTPEEKMVYDIMEPAVAYRVDELAMIMDYSPQKTSAILNHLVKKQAIRKYIERRVAFYIIG